MDIFLIVLRLIHIIAGVFWAGSAFMLVSGILPAVRAAGPAGVQFIQSLVQGNFIKSLIIAEILTVVAGLLLYWRDSGGLQLVWITTPTGLTFTLGGLIGLVALIHSGAVTGRTSEQLGRLGQEIQAGGKPPTPEQMAQVGALQAKLAQAARVTAALLGLALIAMAIARYL